MITVSMLGSNGETKEDPAVNIAANTAKRRITNISGTRLIKDISAVCYSLIAAHRETGISIFPPVK
jgi:hypothetical protein